MLEGRYDDALRLVDDAVAADPEGEARFFHLVFTSAWRRRPGRARRADGQAVRRATDGLPYLAGGWICVMYKAGGPTRGGARSSGGPSPRTCAASPNAPPSG